MKFDKKFFISEIRALFHEELSSFFIDADNIPELFRLDEDIVKNKVNSNHLCIYVSKDFDIESLSSIKVNNEHNWNDSEPSNLYIFPNSLRGIRLTNQKKHNIFIGSQDVNISFDIWRSSNIIIGEATTIMGCRISGGYASLAIMKGNLCSDNVRIQISDQHPIFSTLDGRYCNDFDVFKNYKIGVHSWCGRGATLIKPIIEDNTIIGSDAVLVGRSKPFSVWAGNPARCIKENMSFYSHNIPLGIEKEIIEESFKKYAHMGTLPF